MKLISSSFELRACSQVHFRLNLYPSMMQFLMGFTPSSFKFILDVIKLGSNHSQITEVFG